MTKMEKASTFSRRTVLKAGGALVVSVGMPLGLDAVLGINQARAQGARPPLTPDQLSSYIAVNADGSVSAFFGKTDMAQGLYAGIGQIVAEELDVPFTSVTVIMGNTASSVNQGGASGSTGIQDGGKQMRMAAAEARRVLVEMAAAKLGVPADKLTVTDGVVSDGSSKTSYGELIGGRYFNVALDWNKEIGNALYAPGKAKPKDPKAYKIVGQPLKRGDVAPKVYCQQDFVNDVKVPGMVHGRVIRPPVAGATPMRVDESSVKDIPGVKVVHEKDFLGIVADNEWNAIKAAQALKVEWTQAQPPFLDNAAAIYDHIRKAPVRKRQVEKENGNVDEAFKTAARVIEAEYEWPYQSHSSMGPACARRRRSRTTRSRCGPARPSRTIRRDGVAALLEIPPEKVHGRWFPGSGSYGRNDAGDAAMDAAVLAQARSAGRSACNTCATQGTGWDPKGPASIHRARAAIDASGKVIAYEYGSKGFSRIDVDTNESKPWNVLAGQLLGVPLKSGDGFGVPAESYAFDNKRLYWETIAPLLDRASPLRTSHLRDPVGPQIHFASESFIDEVAAALGVDPVEFRLRYIKDARDSALVKAAAEKAGWQTRPSPRRDQTGEKVSGRGIAYSQRGGTRVAVIAEVDVDRTTGKIWARKFTVAHDCGLIINPDALTQTHRGQCRPGHQPHALGRGRVRPQERDQRGLAHLSDPRHQRDAGEDRRRADQSSGDSRPRAPASRRAGRSRPRSPTRSSMPPACACAACRSRPTR